MPELCYTTVTEIDLRPDKYARDVLYNKVNYV